MCRFLAIKSSKKFDINQHLEKLATIAEHSKEYQGHGWGCCWTDNGSWKSHHSIKPMWKDIVPEPGSTRLLLAHARSAFRDQGIRVENNMPFLNGEAAFVFNGELSGVRIKEEGRIGAEKIFNYVLHQDQLTMQNKILQATNLIQKRTRNIRAMNFVIAEPDHLYAYSYFSRQPDYFTLWKCQTDTTTFISSEPYPEESWDPLPNNSLVIA